MEIDLQRLSSENLKLSSFLGPHGRNIILIKPIGNWNNEHCALQTNAFHIVLAAILWEDADYIFDLTDTGLIDSRITQSIEKFVSSIKQLTPKHDAKLVGLANHSNLSSIERFLISGEFIGKNFNTLDKATVSFSTQSAVAALAT